VINPPTTNASMVGRLVRFVSGEQTGTTPALRDGYALRRKSEARTRARNCSGVSAGGAGAGVGFTTAGEAVFASFFLAAFRAASSASRLVAKSFASASTGSAGAPSRWKDQNKPSARASSSQSSLWQGS